ncbi:hypothetical protein K523DRAFT_101360 [Schizophyllum commune Tattone D]|nr:hypothetical protein K523DRAFT_101360 [Schizophyllum commune Tattone D]
MIRRKAFVVCICIRFAVNDCPSCLGWYIYTSTGLSSTAQGHPASLLHRELCESSREVGEDNALLDFHDVPQTYWQSNRRLLPDGGAWSYAGRPC